jgi:hypothetical protein
MNAESSPFHPGQPVPIEFFVGRTKEIERLRSMVKAARQGRLKIGFVSGERGIGKSSLVSFVRHLSEREEKAAGCHVLLGGVSTVPEMVRRTFDRLLKESIERPWHAKLREFFGKHVREVGLFGISLELALQGKDIQTLTDGFVASLHSLLDRLQTERQVLLLILDDINGLATSEYFANWLKSTVDDIATSGRRLPLCLLVVGLEERRRELVKSQPSLARVFELIEISPWDEGETRQFYLQVFRSAGGALDPDALGHMVEATGGLPVLAHEIGEAVWRRARGGDIMLAEAVTGVMDAADVIGRKHLEPQVLQALRSPRYRSILRKIAELPRGLEFRRAEVGQRLAPDERKVMDNFLRRMKDLGAIISDEESGPGGYRFPNHLHALYFWMESQRSRKGKA